MEPFQLANSIFMLIFVLKEMISLIRFYFKVWKEDGETGSILMIAIYILFTASTLSIQIIRSSGLFYQAYSIGKIKNGFISYDPMTKMLTKTPFQFLNAAGMNNWRIVYHIYRIEIAYICKLGL